MSSHPRPHTHSTRPPRPEAHRGPRNSTRPRQDRPRRARPGADREPVPSTIWAGADESIHPDTTWPRGLITQLLNGLTKPDDTVVLLPVPTSPEHQDGTTAGGTLARAEDTIREHGRPARTVLLDPQAAPTTGAPATEASAPEPGDENQSTATPDEHRREAPAGADLVLSHLLPETTNGLLIEHLAATAARLLAPGGVFAVLTHSDQTGGVLRDPSGLVVAAAHQADLLYLQHLVLLLAPLRNSQLTAAGTGDTAAATPPWHRRIHADALLFVQPTDL